VSDEFIVPLCRIHHRELHRSGDEAAWWQKLNIDPLAVALRLWQHTRLNGGGLAQAGIMSSQGTKTMETSAHVGLDVGVDQLANVDSPVFKDSEPNASR
jgi:hypothetical protein